MPENYVRVSLKNEQPFRLLQSPQGRHRFGGRAPQRIHMPAGATEPVQLVFLLDLHDNQIPLTVEPHVTSVPLLYPFKYGGGGGEIQYAIRSDSEIEVLHLSEEQPDPLEEQYLQIPELPTAQFDLLPLTYEQARILAFSREDGFFQPNAKDRDILFNELSVNNLISLGGRRRYIGNAGDIICRNPACEWFEKPTYFQFLAAVPPIPINGKTDFWHEFQGAFVHFCFGLCRFCNTIIAFNVCT